MHQSITREIISHAVEIACKDEGGEGDCIERESVVRFGLLMGIVEKGGWKFLERLEIEDGRKELLCCVERGFLEWVDDCVEQARL